MLYQLVGMDAGKLCCGYQVLMRQENDRFWLAAVKLVLGESGSLGRLCAGRRVEVRKHWLHPLALPQG